MKVFIVADLEGITGVTSFKHQAHPDGFLYPEARKCFMRDLNAAIDGAFAAGADEILVYDTHFYGLNVLVDELPPNVKAVLGKPIRSGLDQSFDAAMLIGYHAMAGTRGGMLTHTYSLDIRSIRLNGIEVGEIGMEAALAGSLDVPTVMISGDSAGLKEAADLIPGIEVAVVKEVMEEEAARCLPATESEKLIKQKATEGLKRRGEINPFKVAPPFEIRIDITSPEKLERISQQDNVVVEKDGIATITGDDLHSAWLTYKRVEKEFE